MPKLHVPATLLVRVVLPSALLVSIALRPFGLSFIYLLLYLIAPLTQVPSTQTIRGWPGKFLCLTFVVSVLLLLLHIAWHIVLAAFPPYGSLPHENHLVEIIGRNLGLVSYDFIDPTMAIHYLAPELLMAIVSSLVYVLVKKLLSGPNHPEEKPHSKHQKYPLLTSAGKYLCLFLIMFSGIMLPSVTSGIYFLIFMGAATAWSLGQPLERGFAVIGRCLMAIMAVHIAVLLAYQCTWLLELYPPEMNLARYFGLTQLVNLTETNPASFSYETTSKYSWATVASPLVILFTYYALGVETRELFKPKGKKKSALTGVEAGKLNGSLVRGVSFHRGGSLNPKEKWMNATKTVRLIRNMSPSKRWPAGRSRSSIRRLQQDPSGSVIIPDEESNTEMYEPTLMDDILAAIVDFFQVVIRSSYIATTITMMAWSIMYHSWLTFVFLMWANIVWLCQDQRSFMLKTSPVLVLYAMLLLLAQYIYGMDLAEAELPSSIYNETGVNLQQIGLSPPPGMPLVPLLIKSLFTCMFWVTLRQRVQEIRQRRQSAVITDMAAPLQLTVSTAASVIEAQREDEQRSRLLTKVGDFLKAACARYWIYVVVIMLFVIGITGTRMTIFRIVYMFLCLGFILMFQMSWYWWRRLMYIFWITVIIYSMINLILIYIYQFDGFPNTIEKYLHISVQLQNDLGLEPYHPADLFVKLLTPTCFLIITIMQVHYFHKDFMALSDPNTSTNTNSIVRNGNESSRPSNAGASTMKDDVPPLPLEEDAGSITEVEQSLSTYNTKRNLHRKPSRSRSYAPTITEPQSTPFRQWFAGKCACFKAALNVWIDYVFMYMYLHLTKVVFLSLTLVCVMRVCAMHVPIMLIVAPALLLNATKQRIIILFISTLITVYFMAKMVYQIEYIRPSVFDVNCTSYDESTETTYNNAEWLGFTKNRNLAVLLKDYIGLIVVFTFHSLVTYRQQTKRDQGWTSNQQEKVLFPEVTRKEADINLVHCAKYMINYGFYKFGVEVSLICLIGVIGSRMDVYAVLYSFWLLLLVSLKRPSQARVWPAFTVFITILVPIQYMIAVGFLPQFCITYPWGTDIASDKDLRTFLFLPYADNPPHATKLVFDFFLLVFASRQLRVFRLERRGEEYPGGSNSEDIGQDWETPSFVNPVPDFLGVVGTWLDVLKRMVFLGMLWVTLAIMFLTGTNRVNLFSMGYLIGSFIFLWQGTDFYLRPKQAILQWWSWLLRYNVSVVAIKVILQIPGCLFRETTQLHACWLVQLLGIGCVDKFAGTLGSFIKMESYNKDTKCTVPQEDIGLAWDGVCFAFLILQRRLFHSYYFYRVIDESKATTVLASRGAELIEELRQKQMNLQEDQEIRILEKIKVKMERIKANQKKIHGVLHKDPKHHDREEEDSDTQPGDTEAVPLVRGDSDSRGFHTPDSPASPRGFHTPLSESSAPPSRVHTPPPVPRPLTLPALPPPTSSQGGPPSPSSALMTVSLDAYLEPRRISFESPPSSDLLPRAQSPEESYPVFSPPPIRRRHTVASPSLLRTSLISQSSRAEPNSHHTSVRSGDYYMFDDFDDTEVPLKEEEEESDEDAPKEMGLGKVRRQPSVAQKSDLTDQEREGDRDGVSELDDFAPEPEKETIVDKCRRYCNTAWVFISSFLVTATRHLMRYSRDYRYVSRALSMEKRILKEKEGFGIGLREGSQMIWEPLPETLAHPKDLTILEEQEDSMFKQGRSPFLHLAYALWFAVLAHTDIVCYIMVFINQIQSATILSIPLPLMVFLWGTLTIPRPTKTFWVTLIAYTEVIVLIKSMFQFEILPWNQKVYPANMPFTAPRIIGIERKGNYALYDLLLLLIIFLHRFMLKSLGLWKESSPEIDLREDTEYPLTSEDTQMIVEGKSEDVGKKYVQLHDRSGPLDEAADGQSQRTGSRNDPNDDQEREQIYQEQEAGPSRPPEDGDDHYKVNDDEEPIIAVTTTLGDKYHHYPKLMLLSVKRYMRPMKSFFQRMLAPGARVTADVYAYMFLCDFFNFLVVIFGFAAFGTHQGDGGVKAYLEENKVPIPFLVMLILQFALIVIDRALYLRKFMLGKILFQYGLIIGVHVWMFFVLPFITERTFNALLPPPMWYMIKCVYLLLSAHQIRCGYPRRIIGNFLCKSYGFLNMVFFKCFMAVPFVFELRTLMDWIWTDTSMTLMDWLKMEDIFASVFLLKCSRFVEDEYPAPRGTKRPAASKYLLGGTVLAFVIAIIWFPLVFFAFGNTVGQPNPPTDVTVKIRIGPFLPAYQMSAQSHDIYQYTEQDYNQLSNQYARDRTAQTFLSNYMYNDVAVINLNPNSTMNWDISQPELDRLEREAISNNSLLIKFTFTISHPSNNAQNPPTIEDSREMPLDAFYANGTRNKERDTLLHLLQNNASADTWLNVPKLFPKFLKVFNKGTAKPAYQLIPGDPEDESTQYRDVQLRLEMDRGTMYWRVQEFCKEKDELLNVPMNSCDMLVMFTFNDKLFPETLNFISGGGIIGLYTTFVFLASRLLRGFFSGIYTKIMFDDLPNADRVLQLCLDIYLVREALELALEEDLFAKLVFLYRSPETMIKWSRPKDEDADEQRALPPLPRN
ncbi:piezo-type mechanosensitive ion channel component isoform X2 [Cydia strobilella]|uniref:piezo-type mechanosensitive ion channel component isoform X2 n=1 Tax=Cydia strobilella TaxID=1100964 RepID=UPI0030045B0E